MRQPSLFNFKPVETLRRSGFTPEEERELILFCLSDNYPRTHTVKRTGTRYSLENGNGARTLLKNLHYGTKTTRAAMTTPKKSK
jgi:hypothetical protein